MIFSMKERERERERASLQTTFLFRADSPDFLSKRTEKFLCQTLFVIFFFFFFFRLLNKRYFLLVFFCPLLMNPTAKFSSQHGERKN